MPSLPLSATYVSMMAREGHHNPPAFAHWLDQVFRGVNWKGKRVLEIGSGRGLIAIYMGMQGAARVVSMEPEMVGSTSGVIKEQRERLAALGLTNVEVLAADFNTWDAKDEQFDVIVSRASINHLYHSEKHAGSDPQTYDKYVEVARRIHRMLAPGGQFIATDSCRYGFFNAVRHLGINRPWTRKRSGVDWRHHQNPPTWKRIFKQAGFSQTRVDYPVPYRLRAAAPLVNTALANFFLTGNFILRAHR
jgi:SAM-dependent methyltransferase